VKVKVQGHDDVNYKVWYNCLLAQSLATPYYSYGFQDIDVLSTKTAKFIDTLST